MPLSISDKDFKRLYQFIQSNYGINLSQKQQLISSRLSSTVEARGYTDFGPFVDKLLKDRDPQDMELVLNKLTTNYTFFMRETDHFQFFQKTILPDLVRRHQRDKVLAIWSAGCSSGQEAYNIAMVIDQYFGPRKGKWDTTILATDISMRVLNKAKQGIYTEEELKGLPATWRSKYVTTLPDGKFQICERIRKEVVFRPGNLMEPFHFKRPFDLIFCRNVMIYFDAATKESIIKKKILPYFAKRKLSEITAKDIMRWQNEIREMRDCHGKPLSKTYLKTVHNQLSAIFNHAARFYGLNINPARQAGNMGAEERKEMLFWTREEYTKFSEAMMDKPLSFYAFEVLYWCGVREGELLALTPADFDFEKRTLTINKSYQRLHKQDVITTPKTPKSNRVIQMPQFLCDELQDYLKHLYGVEPDSRMFLISKSYLHREMDRGCKQTAVKRIRIHDLRHSHVSLLFDMGFTALAIAERVGHESIDITYRYAHLFPTRQVEMADKLDSLKNEKGV